jgi:hypothetical protein
MLEARIVSPRGSLYYAGEARPYDLETLWHHLRAGLDTDSGDVRIELFLERRTIPSDMMEWMSRIAAHGVEVRLLDCSVTAHPQRVGGVGRV